MVCAAGADDVALALVEEHHVQHVLLVALHSGRQLEVTATAVVVEGAVEGRAAAANCGVDAVLAAQQGVLKRVKGEKLPDFVAL